VRLPDLKPIFLLLLLLGVPLTTGASLAAGEPASTASGAMTNAALAPSKGAKIDLPVPVGEPVKGIKVPQYDENGKLTMSLNAETALKLDDRKVELGKLKVLFSDKEEKEIIVEIPHSILDMETKVLVADSETVIRREDFEIVGQSAEFDTFSRSGTFKGKVHASFQNGAPSELP
jgi:hypothetical protein